MVRNHRRAGTGERGGEGRGGEGLNKLQGHKAYDKSSGLGSREARISEHRKTII